MNKVNYGRMLDEKMAELEKSGEKPSLLLHACCAPCSSHTLLFLHEHFDITLYFCNPNISPESEYLHRVSEIKRLISEMCPTVKFIEGRYEPEKFYEMAKGLENEPERGARCVKCYRMRIEESAVIAKQNNFDYFTTTLSISPQKDSHVLNSIGKAVSEIYDIPYLFSDFKKKGGYKRSIELSAQFHLYRQNFCGCIYSKR